MVSASDVVVTIPTRGNVPLDPILASYLELGIVAAIWDNSKLGNLMVYGRYAAIEHTAAPVILTQDDDCVLPRESIEALLAAYEPGHVTCNMPERFRAHYLDSALVGFGACFDRDLPAQAFARFDGFPRQMNLGVNSRLRDDQWLQRTCDVVFTTLTPRVLVDVPVEILPVAHDTSRMWKQPNHVPERARMLALARRVRDAVPA